MKSYPTNFKKPLDLSKALEGEEYQCANGIVARCRRPEGGDGLPPMSFGCQRIWSQAGHAWIALFGNMMARSTTPITGRQALTLSGNYETVSNKLQRLTA